MMWPRPALGLDSGRMACNMQRATLLAALASGPACADGALQPVNERAPTRSMSPRPPPLGACLDTDDMGSPARAGMIEGRVEEVGLGLPDPAAMTGCPLRSGLLLGTPLYEAPLLAQSSWLRVRDPAGRELTVSALAEGFEFPLTKGDVVRARIALEEIGFGVQANSFEARTGDGGLLFWIGSAPALSDLLPPVEVALSLGEVEAEIQDDCVGSYRTRSLDITIAGATLSVRSGARVEAGPWMLVNAVTQQQTGMTMCPDAFADRIQVAVWAREGQVPETGGMGGPCYADLPLEQAEGAPQYRCLPDGTLTRECGRSAACPGVSECVQGFCVAPDD